jgi:hypothetical protein
MLEFDRNNLINLDFFSLVLYVSQRFSISVKHSPLLPIEDSATQKKFLPFITVCYSDHEGLHSDQVNSFHILQTFLF